MPDRQPFNPGDDDPEGPPPKDLERYVHWRFHQLSNSLNSSSLHLAVQTQTLDGLGKVLDNQAKLIERLSIDVAGDGNGRPGLKAELKDIKRWQGEHDKSAEERAEKTKYLVRWGMGIIGSALTIIITTQFRQVSALTNNQEKLSRNQEMISKQIQQLPGGQNVPALNSDVNH